MVKLTPLSDLTSLTNQTSAIQTINTNNQRIEDALNNTVSRDGSTPNSMSDDLDMDSNRILNLPVPVDPTEPVRKFELDDITLGLTTALLEEAIDAIDVVLEAKADAQAAQAAAEDAAADAAGYIGAAASAPIWTTARDFSMTGDVTAAAVSVDGSAPIVFTTVLAADTVSDTELTTGAAVANIGYTPLNKAGDTGVGGMTYTGEQILPTGLTSLNQYSAGWRATPITTKDTDATFAMDDSGRTWRHTSGSAHAYTIPPNSSVAYPIGTVLVIRNVGSGAVTLTRGSGVALRIAGTSTDSNKVVTQWGYVSLLKEDTNTWVATGAGIS